MTTSLRILILEDRPADAELMVHELRRAGYDPQWTRAETEAEFRAGLKQEPDLVLSDFSLPQYDALHALRLFREKQRASPFIVVSGTIGDEQAVGIMREGATDYVSKNHLERLGPAVIRALKESQLRREKQQTEEQLHLHAAALAAAANGIMITDREGTIIWANPALLAMTGYSLEEVQGQNPRLFKSGQQEPSLYKNLWDTILAGQVWRGELTNKRKDGTLYQEEMIITPVRAGDGEITHFIATKQDVTQSKQLQAQLMQAQKMEAIGRLAGGVAHDFNNLLTVICGCSEILLSTRPEESKQRELLGQIWKAGDRAAGLTRQLLAFSRKQILQPRVLDLNAEVAELHKMLGRLVGEDIDLTILPGPDLYPIWADPGQIQQVLMNLVVNARDAMIGGGKLTIATCNVELNGTFIRKHPDAHPGSYVLLEVSDTGCGMTAEVQGRIFEPFFTTKELGKGTGLGLATVLGIVDQSGGCIEVDSKLGHGTVFRIYLPRARTSESSIQAQPSSPGLPRGGETILVVEDDEAVRNLVAMILRSAGYTVLEARDGADGLAVFEQRSGPLHLLLTDVVMPQVDGCQLADRLMSQAPATRVIFMSGYLDDALVRHGIQEKGLPFLHKPFNAGTLLQKVREVLDQPVAVSV